MTQRSSPPFRADHVGSFLRPKELLDAREQCQKGAISKAQLREVEDRAIGDIVKYQEDLGLTGITDGDLLKGVRYFSGGCTTQSIVMRSKSGTVRMIDAYHRLSKLNEYSAVDFTGDKTAAYPLP